MRLIISAVTAGGREKQINTNSLMREVISKSNNNLLKLMTLIVHALRNSLKIENCYGVDNPDQDNPGKISEWDVKKKQSLTVSVNVQITLYTNSPNDISQANTVRFYLICCLFTLRPRNQLSIYPKWPHTFRLNIVHLQIIDEFWPLKLP